MQSNNPMRRLALRAALLCVLSALGASALPAVASALPNTGIKGTVTSSTTPHKGLGGTRVCAFAIGGGSEEKCEYTNPSGEYEIKELKAEEYEVQFTVSGYEGTSRRVKVEAGKTKEVNVELVELQVGNISGQVTNASNGQGLGGVDVCVQGTEESCTVTNSSGGYTISNVIVGTHTVNFSPDRYSLQFSSSCEEELGVKVRCTGPNVVGQSVGSVQVKPGETTNVSVQLQAGGQITGTVTNASITHPGITKIEVSATRVNGKGEAEGCTFEEFEFCGGYYYAWTSSSGAYTINGLPSGSYKVDFDGDICTEVANEGKKETECVPDYIGDFYHEQPTFKKAQTISVTVGQTTSAISESLRESFPTTPASTAAPTLTGTPVVGQTLSCSQGSWSHEPTSVAYQWLRNGTVISGQTGSTYTVGVADPGNSISCVVWAGNGAGVASATSNTVAIPVPLAVFASVKVKGSLASVALRCPGPGACSGVLKLVVSVRHGKRTSKVTIGQAKFSIAVGKSATVPVRLTAQGSKLLRQAGRKGLAVQVAGSGVRARAAKLKPAAPKKRR